MLQTLNNNGYYVTRPFTAAVRDNCTFDYLVYKTLDGQGIQFMFGVIVGSALKSVSFNDTRYNNVDDLLTAVKLFNDTRMFPAEYYDPSYNERYRTESKISWYLVDKLGFKSSRSSIGNNPIYVKKDLYGNVVCQIMVIINDDCTGSIVRSVDGSSLMENAFTCAVDAVSKINGILTYETAHNVMKNLEVLDCINKYDVNINGITKTTVSRSFNVFKEDYKDKIIRELESILDKLK